MDLQHALTILVLGIIGFFKALGVSIFSFLVSEGIQIVTAWIGEWPDELKKLVAGLMGLFANFAANLMIPPDVYGPVISYISGLLVTGGTTLGGMLLHDLLSLISKKAGNHPSQNPQAQFFKKRWEPKADQAVAAAVIAPMTGA